VRPVDTHSRKPVGRGSLSGPASWPPSWATLGQPAVGAIGRKPGSARRSRRQVPKLRPGRHPSLKLMPEPCDGAAAWRHSMPQTPKIAAPQWWAAEPAQSTTILPPTELADAAAAVSTRASRNRCRRSCSARKSGSRCDVDAVSMSRTESESSSASQPRSENAVSVPREQARVALAAASRLSLMANHERPQFMKPTPALDGERHGCARGLRSAQDDGGADRLRL
jgi:hypothetical protein